MTHDVVDVQMNLNDNVYVVIFFFVRAMQIDLAIMLILSPFLL